MAERPTLTLVPDCGMTLRTRNGPNTTLRRINVRSKLMPRNPRQSLKSENLPDRDLLAPLGDCLGLDPHLASQVSFGTDVLENESERGIVHDRKGYTGSLQLATEGLSRPSRALGTYHKRMVDKDRQPRLAPANSPIAYDDFGAWLTEAIGPYGMGSALARFCGVRRQNVYKWQEGSVPDDPGHRRLIAQWARVEYGSLRDLIERHETRKAKAAREADSSDESAATEA